MIPKITGDEFIKACESNDLETVTMHLHEHADYVNANGDSGLSWAAVRGNLEIVNLLMSASHLNINLVSKNLTSPLTLAASMGHTDIVKQLMTCKTLNVNHVDQHGYSALLWAFQKNNWT